MARSLPSLLLGLTLAAYWGRVVRMAIKARQRTGRGANWAPPEPLGRALRVVWAPAIGVWVAAPFVSAFARRPPAAFRLLGFNVFLAWGAVVVAGIAFALTRVCWKKMGKAWRMGIDPGEKNPLIATGLFAYVRHPIYAMSQGMALATLAALPSVALLTAVALHVLLIQWEARREERHMLGVHGPAYGDYLRAVGRFVPRGGFRARPYGGGGSFHG